MRQSLEPFAVLLCVLSALGAAAPMRAAASGADVYAQDDAWLCRPGRHDACGEAHSTTRLTAQGTLLPAETIAPDAHAPIDCFYVYPTVSADPKGNSDLKPGPAEERAVTAQFAAFASVCKPYAPLYRQITLAGLMSRFSGHGVPVDTEIGYQDVLAAWKHYLKYDNHGRGVVLIGHSQGANVLRRLIKEDIDDTPLRNHLVSAILLGSNVEVPLGQEMGGSFAHIPACTSATQTGCVIAFVSFRANAPPPGGGVLHFGYAATAGMETLCTDPVALSGRPLESIFPVAQDLLGNRSVPPSWHDLISTVHTPLITLDGVLDAHCAHHDGASYLAVFLPDPPVGLEPSDIPGDLVVRGQLLRDWGLHLDDVNLALGNLLSIVQVEGQTFNQRVPALIHR